MANLSLKVSIVERDMVKTMSFEPSTIVYDACRAIRECIVSPDALGSPNEFGLFLADDDPKKGVWLESGHALEYYLLRDGDLIEYRKKQRRLRVRTMDETVKTLQVDDSQTIGQLLVTVCSKLGITNHEEFSLVNELDDEEKEKTLTLRRDKSLARDQKKLDEMKKKLHTDDELNWLDHSKTLREHGIDESQTLLLRRKYFFSDQNVDARDPVQLNLLYVQSRDAIINGTHPVTNDEAITFAGLICQIQFGDFIESKHKVGFLSDLKDFLPKEYTKVKGAEKKILYEHSLLKGLSEVEAKLKFTTYCRSLKTYGITFFLVKEKMKGKNKLVPRLLGINKESVVRVDERSKEILKTWPLTTVKRWAASPNSFTLDFGDYSESYYSVQTTEGEQISQLISGYVDITLRKKKAKDHLGIDGDEESAMYEDTVSPAKATIIQHQSTLVGRSTTGSVALPGVLRTGGEGGDFSMGSMQRSQHSEMNNQFHNVHAPMSGQSADQHQFSGPQRALLHTIHEGLSVMTAAETELDREAQIPTLGGDAASKKWKENQLDLSQQKVGSQLSAMSAATAQLVTLTSAGHDETDFDSVGAAVTAISSNMGEFSHDVKMLATLQDVDSDGESLLDAARRLVGAFSHLLSIVSPASQEPRQNLLAAANKVGEASQDLMQKVDPGHDLDRAFQDTLLALAKAVANATAALVLKAKVVANTCDDQAQQNKVISSATQCALATSQLVACTKVVAPTIASPACQEQLIDAAKLVAKSVEGIVEASQVACTDEQLLQDLGAAATAVTKALNDLMQHIKDGTAGGDQSGKNEQAVTLILGATDRLFSSLGDAPEMVKQAKILAQATTQLVNAIRFQADSASDADLQKKLLAAAKALADATAKMVEAAKGCASHPNDSVQQHYLKVAAEELRSATNAAASNAIKKRVIHNLVTAAKQAASAATQLINSANIAGKCNRNMQSQQQLMHQCKIVSDLIPGMVHGIKQASNNPDSASAQLALINACHDFLAPVSKQIATANAAAPTITDQATLITLTNHVKAMSTALSELRIVLAKAQESCGTLEVDSAIDQVRRLNEELDDIQAAADAGKLLPLPNETAQSSAAQLGTTHKVVGSTMAQLLTAAVQGNEDYTGIASRDTANALRTLVAAVRGVAATSSDRRTQTGIIEAARGVIAHSATLLTEAKRAASEPDNPHNQDTLQRVAKMVSQSLNNCVNCMPGQQDVDNAIENITSVTHTINTTKFPSTSKPFQDVQIDVKNSAGNLSQAAIDLVTSTQGTPGQLADASGKYSGAYKDLVDKSLLMAGATNDSEVQHQIVTGLKSVSMVSSKLLVAAKSVHADPKAPSANNLLAQAARAVMESINHLIDVCTMSAPGQKECDNALRQIQMMRPMLENPREPVSDATYFECLDSIMDQSKTLAEAMTGISSHARMNATDKFSEDVQRFAGSICGLTESSAHAAYLVGVSDPASEPGRPGLVDQSQFARANQAIQMACESLADPANSQKEVLTAATVVAKYTSALCSICRVASSRTNNPVAKRHFVQGAKDVANSTANLVKAIKALDVDFTDENRQKCADAAIPLIKAVDELNQFASSPEFASVPATISTSARKAQEPIINSGLAMIDGAMNMIHAAKLLAANPNDPSTYQQYSTHSKSVSDSIKNLVSSTRDSAPGQHECDEVINEINRCIRQLDQASLAAINQSLAPQEGKTLKGYEEQIINSARELLEFVDKVRDVAKGESEHLGHTVSAMSCYYEPLTQGAIGAASKVRNSKQQMSILDQTKTVVESGLQLMFAAKEGGGNPKAVRQHGIIDEAADSMREVLNDLLKTLEEAASQAGLITSMIDSITKSINQTDDLALVTENSNYVDYQTNIVSLAKQLARTADDMVGKSGTNVGDLGSLANQLTRDFAKLSAESRGAITVSGSAQLSSRIKSSIQDLGKSCIDLVTDASKVQADPNDAFSRRDLTEHARVITEKVSYVLASVQAGSRGTQACINAASTVSGIIGDLDTTIMFASAGTLNNEGTESFKDHRENILKTAKALVEDTKTLVSGAASNQEELATAAQIAVKTITRLADVVKFGASTLGSDQPEAQVLLINAVKDVASALSDLICATKNASGKNVNDPAMVHLKDAAKVMVTNVTSLLKTVKTVEDEAARGTRALESSIEAISQEIKAYDNSQSTQKTATAEDLIRNTKSITMATAKAVAAGKSCQQDDIITAANMGRKAVTDLLTVCKAAAQTAETDDIKSRTLEAGRATAVVYRSLLQNVNLVIQQPSAESKQKLVVLSRHVASSVTELVHSAEAIKGSDWVDPDDPTVIAENELLGAASSIEAAALKLSQLKPRQPNKEADMNLDFEGQILNAAKSIASAISALIKAATVAQRELLAQGKMFGMQKSRPEVDDGQWSQGLISAARMVAAATHSLCEAANAMIQGHASEEKLIASAKEVAGSTAALLVACKVKADPGSQSMERLQAAGNAVKRATEALVSSAQKAREWQEDEENLAINKRMVGGIAQEIMAQEAILKKEKELETARRKLADIRRARYKDPSATDDSDSSAF